MKSNKQSKIIISLCIFALLLITFRVIYTKSEFYLFMVWNLFLAIVPYLISKDITKVSSKLKLIIALPIWLIFLPNAPYMITDLVHLHQGTKMPIWYDLVLILSYAFIGMLLFIISLNNVFFVIKRLFSNKKAWIFTVLAMFLSSFGIYLGRYLRWNSWDIIHKPQLLFNDVISRFIHPTHHPRTWGITLSFGFFFLLVFIGYKKTLNQINQRINEDNR